MSLLPSLLLFFFSFSLLPSFLPLIPLPIFTFLPSYLPSSFLPSFLCASLLPPINPSSHLYLPSFSPCSLFSRTPFTLISFLFPFIFNLFITNVSHYPLLLLFLPAFPLPLASCNSHPPFTLSFFLPSCLPFILPTTFLPYPSFYSFPMF